MAACYTNYDLSGSQGVSQHPQQTQTPQHLSVHQSSRLSSGPPQKDYTIPLHVDCSVEYELPNQAKPPAGARVEPLLMIHPCYFRKMESQRRSPFINNMPNSSRSSTTSGTTTPSSSRRSSRNSQVSSSQHRQQQQQQQHQQQLHQQLAQQIQQQQMSQQTQYPVHSNGQQQHQSSANSLSTSSSNQYNMEQSRHAVIHNHSHNQNSHNQQIQQQNQVQSTAATTSWDQIAAVAAVATSMTGLVGIPGTVNITGQSMYSKPVGKRDAMLSGGCGLYSNSSEVVTTGRWEPERSPMAAVPRDYQAGPDATPILTRDDKHILSGKYRQYLRAHRLHPYMMAGSVSSFPQLTSTAFPQMQQVSCYNV